MLATCCQRQAVTAVPDRAAVEELEDYVRVTVKVAEREEKIEYGRSQVYSFSIMNSYLSGVDLEASELIYNRI